MSSIREKAETIAKDFRHSMPHGLLLTDVEGQLINAIEQALRDERERCAKAICLFCAEPEHYDPPKEIEGSKRLWHADLRNDCNGVVQCQAAAIRKED